MEVPTGENPAEKIAEPENVEQPKSELEKWVGEGKQYTPPEVTPEMVTQELFEAALENIRTCEPAGKDLTTQNKGLTKELLEALWNFTSPLAPLAFRVTALQWLGDASRLVHNRHMIGGLFQPCSRLIQFIASPESLDILKQSIRLLANLAFDNPYVRDKCIEVPNSISTIVTSALGHSSVDVQRLTAGLVANLCSGTETLCSAFQSEGALPRLLALAHSPDDNVQCMIARALRNISETEDIRLSLIASGLYDYCLKVLRETEGDDGMVREFLGTLNALLLTRTAFTDFICKHEAIPLLITLLERATEVELIAEIIDMMTPWAETAELQSFFLAQGQVPRIFNLFRGNVKGVRIESRVACGKLCGSLAANDEIMKLLFPMLSDFVVLFEDAELEVRAVAGAALSNLARSDEACAVMIKEHIPEKLVKVISNKGEDMRLRNYASATIRNISIHPDNKMALLQLGVMEACVKLLAEKEHHVAIFSAIGVLKSLLGGEDDLFVERLISAGGLEPLIAFQSFNESDHVRFESCRVVALLYKKKSAHLNPASLNAKGGLLSLQMLATSKFDILKKEAEEALALAEPQH